MREIHTQPAPYVCKCLADADALSPDLEKLLRLVCPKPKQKKNPLRCSTVPVILRQTSNKQQAALANKLGRRKSSHGSRLAQSPSTTPPRLFSDRHGGSWSSSLQTPLCSQKDETGNAFRFRPLQRQFPSLARALISRASVPRSPDPRRRRLSRLAMAH